MKLFSDVIIPIGLLVFIVALVSGWILNIYCVATGSFDPITGLMVLRVVGIFIPPLGAVLGFV